MVNEKTNLYNVSDINKELVKVILKEVYLALEERGYDPINQLVGYIISGDPGYISSYKDSRSKIQKLDRSKIVEILLTEFQVNF